MRFTVCVKGNSLVKAKGAVTMSQAGYHRGRHPHLIDLDNGRIEKIDVSGLAELLGAEARRPGFRIVNYRLQMMVSALEPAG